MVESAVVVAIVSAAFGLTGLLGALAHTNSWTVCLGVLAAGVTCNVVFGAGYHLALWQALWPKHSLPARWWWSPTRYHPLLDAGQRRRVLPWFYCGAASFVGVLAVAIAILFIGTRDL